MNKDNPYVFKRIILFLRSRISHMILQRVMRQFGTVKTKSCKLPNPLNCRWTIEKSEKSYEISDCRAFTLIELLIVIAIIAILGSATVMVLNPQDMMKNARDSARISDLNTLSKSVNSYGLKNFDYPFAAANIVYTSLPDSSATCASYTLPSLPSGWNYNCVTQSDLTKANGIGWLPIDLTILDSSLSSLPIDPINNIDNFYTAVIPSSGYYEISGKNESQKQYLIASNDGGDDGFLFEKGNSLRSTPYLNTGNSMKTVTDLTSVKIVIAEYSNCGQDLLGQLSRVGFTNYVDISATASTVNDVIAHNPDVIISSRGCWGVAKYALLNDLYDLGYPIYSTGNDTSNNIRPITGVIGASFIAGSILPTGSHPTHDGWTTTQNIVDNGNAITSVRQSAVVVASDNYIEAVYLQEPEKGKWFHFQPLSINDVFFKNIILYLAR